MRSLKDGALTRHGRSSKLFSCLGVEVCWNLEVRVLACVMRKEVHVQSGVAWLL
jgi:hypothetical protein